MTTTTETHSKAYELADSDELYDDLDFRTQCMTKSDFGDDGGDRITEIQIGIPDRSEY